MLQSANSGHETTSGLLSFLFYCLLDNPRVYGKLQEEIDTVIGKSTVTFEHMSKLPYLEACLRETLRLYPTAPALTLVAKGDQIVADGRYLIKNGENILLLLENLHRDPEVRQMNTVRKMLIAAVADVFSSTCRCTVQTLSLSARSACIKKHSTPCRPMLGNHS
jgi:hypothetical protein